MTVRGITLNVIEAATLYVEECYLCGVVFALPTTLRAERLKDHRNFWCPNGHDQHYLGKTDAQKLREVQKQLEWSRSYAQSVEDQRQAAERSNTALRGVVTKKKKELGRVKNGVCPCCKRSFQNLRRHIEGQHPDYAPEGK